MKDTAVGYPSHSLLPTATTTSSQVCGGNPTTVTYGAVYLIYIKKHTDHGRPVIHLK